MVARAPRVILAALTLIALGLVLYATLHIETRPGLFAGVVVATYNLSTYLGPIGAIAGVIALAVAAAALAKRSDRPPLASELALAALLALSLISMLYAPDAGPALQFGARTVILAFASYLYGRAFGDHPRFVPDLALACAAALVLCEPGFVLQLSAGSARMSGSVTAVGASFLIGIPFAACVARLVLDDGLSRARVAGLLAFLVLLLWPIALSFGTRGVFVAGGASLGAIVLRRLAAPDAARFVRRSAIAAIAIAAAGGALWLVLTQSDARLALNTGRLVGNFTRMGVLADTAITDRLHDFAEALRIWGSAPWFGHGLASFHGLASETVDDYPHNAFLEILVSTGAIGAVLFAAGIFPILLAALKAMFVKPADWTAGFVFAALLDAFMRHQASASISGGKAFFLLAGVAVARNYPLRQAAPDRRTIEKWSSA